MKFELGDRVVCINDSSHKNYGFGPSDFGLRKGKEYIVLGIKECSCGNPMLDVGLKSPLLHIHCSICTEPHGTDSIAWCGSYRFVKIEPRVIKEYITVSSEVEIQEPILN